MSFWRQTSILTGIAAAGLLLSRKPPTQPNDVPAPAARPDTKATSKAAPKAAPKALQNLHRRQPPNLHRRQTRNRPRRLRPNRKPLPQPRNRRSLRHRPVRSRLPPRPRAGPLPPRRSPSRKRLPHTHRDPQPHHFTFCLTCPRYSLAFPQRATIHPEKIIRAMESRSTTLTVSNAPVVLTCAPTAIYSLPSQRIPPPKPSTALTSIPPCSCIASNLFFPS